jgi:hypothetical protein
MRVSGKPKSEARHGNPAYDNIQLPRNPSEQIIQRHCFIEDEDFPR